MLKNFPKFYESQPEPFDEVQKYNWANVPERFEFQPEPFDEVQKA